MLVAAAFTVLKLMRSFFAKTIDFHRGRSLFHRSIQAIRATSVVNNDLQWRLAELMVQMWNGARLESTNPAFNREDESPIQMDDTLQLKVRCRHSMSLVFDSVWRWREEFQTLGRSIDGKSTKDLATTDIRGPYTDMVPTAATKNPTHPDSANESTTSSQLDSTLMPSTTVSTANILTNGGGALTPGATGLSAAPAPPSNMIGGVPGYNENAFDFFDPQHWMLDGLVDFNYSFVPPLEGA